MWGAGGRDFPDKSQAPVSSQASHSHSPAADTTETMIPLTGLLAEGSSVLYYRLGQGTGVNLPLILHT